MIKKQMKKNKKRGLSYYFRIDFTTIQGKITGGFMAIAMLAFIMLMVNTFMWDRIVKDRDYIIKVVSPSKYQIEKLNKEIYATVAAHARYPEDVKGRQDIWRNDVNQSIVALDEFSQQWKDKASKVYFEQIKVQVENIRRLQGGSNEYAYLSALDQLQVLIEGFLNEQHKMQTSVSLNEESHKSRIVWAVIIQYMVAFVFAAAIGSVIIRTILGKFRDLKNKIKEMAKGNLPEEIAATKDELNSIVSALNELILNLRNITLFATEVGKGKFDNDIAVFNNEGDLGKSLAEMRDSLKNVADEEKIRNWSTHGITRFGDLLRIHNHDLDQLADVVTRELVKYVDANQGSVFVVDHLDNSTSLQLKSCYAFDRKKYVQKTILPGQGLVGQAFLEKEKIYLTDVPNHYVKINSGLGASNPGNILILPMKFNEEVVGVIEVAAIHKFKEYQIAFLEKVAENIGAAIANVKGNQETKRLLEESQMVAEQLRAQEEEMRQNSEELEATQEEINRQIKEISNQKEMFISLISNVNGIIYRSDYHKNWAKTYISDAVELITGYPTSVFLSGKKNLSELVHPEDFTTIKLKIDDAIQKGESFAVQYRLICKDGVIIWVEDSGKAIYDDEGNVAFVDGVIMNVTHKMQKAEVLTEK
jgi:PAS domain S-box-containing protein